MKEEVISVEKTKKENHKQRAYLNSITSILDYAGNQIAGFIVSPFIVNGLGNSMYGIYQMLNQMTGYANLADTRASQVLKWTVAQKRDIASKEELRSELTTALAVTSLTLPLVLLFGAVLTWYAPIITQADERYFDLIRIACSLMVFSLIIYQAFSLFESLLRGMNLGFKGMGIRATIIGLAGLLKVLAITQGYGLIGLGAVQVFIALITTGVFYLIIKKNVSWFGFGKTNKKRIISYTKISGWYMGMTFSNMVLINSDKLILGYLIGPEFVTIFVLTLFSTKAMEGVIRAVISGIIPGVGKFFGNGEFEKIKEARSILTSVIWLLVSAIGVAILLYNHSFILLWVGEGRYAGDFENMLLLMIGVQFIFFYLDGNFINATLDMTTKVLLTVISSLITVVLAFILVQKYYILGMCFSILIGRFILTIGYPVILKKKMNEKIYFLDRDNIRPILVAISLFSIAVYFGKWIRIEGWLYLIGIGGITTIGVVILFYFIGLTKNSREKIFQIISNIKLLGLKNIEK